MLEGEEIDAKEEFLCAAIGKGVPDVKKWLDSKQVNINVRGEDNSTALMYAAKFERFDVLKFLIEEGADVTLKDSNGATALTLASQYGHADIVEKLIEAGSDVGHIAQGGTPLHWAARNGHTKVVEALSWKGANINAITTDGGATPLMLAVISNNAECVKKIIAVGADVHLKDNNGINALDYAKDLNKLESGTKENSKAILDSIKEAIKEAGKGTGMVSRIRSALGRRSGYTKLSGTEHYESDETSIVRESGEGGVFAALHSTRKDEGFASAYLDESASGDADKSSGLLF